MLKPDRLPVKAPQRERMGAVADRLVALKLNSVCQEPSRPTIIESFAETTATFLIMGPACTPGCACGVIDFDKCVPSLDPIGPGRRGEAVPRLGLRHVVINAVNRDDLAAGGASHQFVACSEQVRRRSPGTTSELLIPDVCGECQAPAGQPVVTPGQFKQWRKHGKQQLGFRRMASSPRPRSSHHGGDVRRLMQKH